MVSIIIPCYNGEKYLKRCLDSVINQTYKNIEIIFINDGSTDNTDKLVKEYKDKRIKYFKRDNHGIGKTRNFGIIKATGEYITFLDVDDYLDKKAIEKMVNKIKEDELDMVISDYYTNKQKTIIVDFKNTNLKKYPRLLLDINMAPWNKMYKKELIRDIKFIEDLKYEDMPFVINALLKAKKIGKVNYFTHYYTLNSGGQTTTRDKKMFDIFKILDIIGNDIKDIDYLDDIYKELVIKTICNYNIQQRYQENKNIRHDFINEGFKFMKKVDNNYKRNNYFKARDKKKSIIEKSKLLSKLYCDLYKR